MTSHLPSTALPDSEPAPAGQATSPSVHTQTRSPDDLPDDVSADDILPGDMSQEDATQASPQASRQVPPDQKRTDAPVTRKPMSAEASADLRNQVVALLPALRAFARALTRARDEADDLVQETLLKALSNIDRFEPGTNLRAWLFTILRNSFYTNIRKRRRENDGLAYLAGQDHRAGPEQEWALTLKSLEEALTRLPDDQREALVLVGAAGLSYEEAANVCGCAVGTIKSRVNRARTRLLGLMGAQDSADMVEPDVIALSTSSHAISRD